MSTSSPIPSKPSVISDSLNAINIVMDVVMDNTIRPIDPNDKDMPRLLELKRLLDERKKRQEEDQQGKSS